MVLKQKLLALYNLHLGSRQALPWRIQNISNIRNAKFSKIHAIENNIIDELHSRINFKFALYLNSQKPVNDSLNLNRPKQDPHKRLIASRTVYKPLFRNIPRNLV